MSGKRRVNEHEQVSASDTREAVRLASTSTQHGASGGEKIGRRLTFRSSTRNKAEESSNLQDRRWN